MPDRVAPTGTAGRALAEAGSIDELLAVEDRLGLSERFEGLDELVGQLLEAAFAGKPLLNVRYGDRGEHGSVQLAALSETQHHVVDDQFSLVAQEARGAWYIPEQATIIVGWCNIPSHMAQEPRFAINVARDESLRLDLRAQAEAVFVWAVLAPLMGALIEPLQLRSGTGKLTSAVERQAEWAIVTDRYQQLGLSVDGALARIGYGSGYGQLRLDEQVARRQALIAELASQAGISTARHWRATQTQALVNAFYAKAKKHTPLASEVLKRPVQPALSAVFAGGWLSFLDYLGETVNAGEQITIALPEPHLNVPDQAKAATAAAATNVPIEEVNRIVATFLGQAGVESPINARVEVLTRWWAEFDRVHAAQRPGMPALWGFVDDGYDSPVDNLLAGRQPEKAQYRRLLEPALATEIDTLWSGHTLARWPARIVTEFHPHQMMADTFGAGVAFWHGVGLTCWFICEGPHSRTDLAGLADHYRQPLGHLAESGFPVDNSLFDQLEQAESRLGPPQDVGGQGATYEVRPGVSVTMQYGGWQRRDGFEILRDIVTNHRRAWATRLDEYLHDRWDTELRHVDHEYNRHIAARTKAPTLKQFAAFATTAANHWFGGDLHALYVALGEPAPATTAREQVLYGDPIVFVEDVYRRIGGTHADSETLFKDVEVRNRQWQLSSLATNSLKYVQLCEALGRAPSAQECGAQRLRLDPLGGEAQGWPIYVRAIEDALAAAKSASQAGAADHPLSPASKPETAPPFPSGTGNPARWVADPTRRFEYRYWDGQRWTEHVSTAGQQSTDVIV